MGKPCPDPSILTREFLYNAYRVEGRTVLQIARSVKCRNGTVIRLLQEYGLSQNVTKEWLIEHYVTLQETTDDMAVQLGCSEGNVRAYLRKFKIPIKKRGKINIPQLSNRTWLYEQYVTLGFSTCKIADDLNVAVSSVQSALNRLNIPLRPVGTMSPTGKKHSYRRNFSHRKRRLIYQRDNHTCQWPGCGSTSNLDVHHIIAARKLGNTDLDNGITLCEHCHVKTYGREEEFAPLFQTIISLKKSGAAHLVSTPIQLRMFCNP
ncbi:MAG TPA: HNH endonuclease signature motif containing protein [Ktedonobacteraceae bacterium]|nr:HNH endonuclease signature motif containing protein [Ktedonobacteraceae bacterium]